MHNELSIIYGATYFQKFIAVCTNRQNVYRYFRYIMLLIPTEYRFCVNVIEIKFDGFHRPIK